MTLSTVMSARIAATQTNPQDHGTPTAPIELVDSRTLADGNGASQANLLFSDKRTIAASGSDNLDLNGVLLDFFGATLSMLKVKAILIRAADANVNDVIIGNGTNPFVGGFGAGANTFTLKPGGVFYVSNPINGWTVTPATGDILKIANSGAGTSVDYDIVVIGTT